LQAWQRHSSLLSLAAALAAASLALPAAELHVRIERDHEAPEIWVDVARGIVRRHTGFADSMNDRKGMPHDF